MINKSLISLVLPVMLLTATPAFSQVTLSGSIQSDILFPQDDEKIETEHYDDKVLTNTYVDLKLGSKYVDAGGRFEFLKYPLPGYETDLKGWGVPHFYVKGHYKNVELTLGDYYEQFGSGFVLRTYEERSLGIDNALRGARLNYTPVAGVTLKALTGKQRRYWHHNDALVSGADLEIAIDQFIKKLQEHDTHITLGGSWVNKHEDNKEDIFIDATHKLNLPKYVNAWDARLNVTHKGFSILAEYAQKSSDPSFDNMYHYGKGNVAMLSASYSRKGMSLLLQAKRSENMSFRSRRSMDGTSSFINHMPPFTHDQTYALPAQYPYATQFDGEWAFQVEAGYSFKKGTALGGKYGTKVKANFSHVRGLDQGDLKYPVREGSPIGSDGYKSSFFKMGDETFYQDIDVQIEKRFTRDFSLIFMYMNQRYNMTVVEGHGGMITSNILVADGKYKFSPKLSLRCELQYQFCDGDEGDWAFGLAELSWAPHWMFTVSDTWNCGETKIHYYQALVTYTLNSHRIQAGYGRTNAGYNCSGGVCRWVPATRGFTLSYNYSF